MKNITKDWGEGKPLYEALKKSCSKGRMIVIQPQIKIDERSFGVIVMWSDCRVYKDGTVANVLYKNMRILNADVANEVCRAITQESNYRE